MEESTKVNNLPEWSGPSDYRCIYNLFLKFTLTITIAKILDLTGFNHCSLFISGCTLFAVEQMLSKIVFLPSNLLYFYKLSVVILWPSQTNTKLVASKMLSEPDNFLTNWKIFHKSRPKLLIQLPDPVWLFKQWVKLKLWWISTLINIKMWWLNKEKKQVWLSNKFVEKFKKILKESETSNPCGATSKIARPLYLSTKAPCSFLVNDYLQRIVSLIKDAVEKQINELLSLSITFRAMVSIDEIRKRRAESIIYYYEPGPGGKFTFPSVLNLFYWLINIDRPLYPIFF